MNNNELTISNTSYTNLDFESIYPEIVELVKSLTNKWDPDSTNESDPAKVLLKLAAFVADKNNYHIDKNILELFLPGATQIESARKIAKLQGYIPGYYKSAVANLKFSYSGDETYLPEDGSNCLYLPKYTTTFTSDSGYTYTLIEDILLISYDDIQYGDVIEGSLNTLNSGSNSLVLSNNLTTDKKVYFPVENVAENGIFVSYYSTSDSANGAEQWTQVDNILTEELGSLVYEFGVDNTGCYIQFPQDIDELIEEGLIVRYTTSSGISGNTTANSITTMNSSTLDIIYTADGESVTEDWNPIDSSYVVITNPDKVENGADPETVDDIYDSMQRVVGTFDTLISVLDYTNYINTLTDSVTGNKIISNGFAADRRTDINSCFQFYTYDAYGLRKIVRSEDLPSSISGVSIDVDSDYKWLLPYTILLYPFKYVSKDSTNTYNYINSFTPAKDATLEVYFESEDYAQEIKSLDIEVTDVSNLSTGDTHVDGAKNSLINYATKVYYILDITLYTNTQVGTQIESQIITNVRNALLQNFNCGEVKFGEELSLDYVREVILDSDARLKEVQILVKEQTPYFMDLNGNDFKVINELSDLLEIIDDLDSKEINLMITFLLKNILQGKTSLYEWYDNFQLDFGCKKLDSLDYSVLENVVSISPELKLPGTSTSSGYQFNYTLGENETIQIIKPGLVTEVTYPVYVNYRWLPSDSSTVISANEDYVLKSSDVLKLSWTDSSDSSHTAIYTVNTITEDGVLRNTESNNIIRPSFELKSTTLSSTASVTILGEKYDTIEGSNTIEKRKLNTNTFSDNKLYCYWITNDTVINTTTGEEETRLFYSDNYKCRILQDGEYFIYTTSDKSSMSILGSGTILYLDSAPSTAWTIEPSDIINIEDLVDVNNLSLEDINWQTKLVSNNNLHIINTEIITLGEENSFSLTTKNLTNLTTGATSSTITKDIQTISSDNFSLTYTINSEQKTVLYPSTLDNVIKLCILSKLLINSNTDLPQLLNSENDTVTFTCKEVSGYENDEPVYTEVNYVISGKSDERVEFRTDTLVQTDQVVTVALSNAISVCIYEDITDTYLICPSLLDGTYTTDSSLIEAGSEIIRKNADNDIKLNSLLMFPSADYSQCDIKLHLLTPLSNLSDSLLASRIGFYIYVSPGDEDIATYKVSIYDENDNKLTILNDWIIHAGPGNTTLKSEITLKDGFNYIEISLLNIPGQPTSVVYNKPAYIKVERHYETSQLTMSGTTFKITDEDAAAAQSLLLVGNLHYINNFNYTGWFEGDLSTTNTSGATKIDAFLNKLIDKLAIESCGIDNKDRTLTERPLFYPGVQDTDINQIETDLITSAEGFWDSNNVYNKITIAEIDFGAHSEQYSTGAPIPSNSATTIKLSTNSKLKTGKKVTVYG